MAVDFQVVFPTEVIELNSVRYIRGAAIPTLDIVGRDFRSIDQVLINDIASPQVVVLSKNRMTAELPEQYRSGTTSLEVVVTSRKLTITPRSVIQFKVGRTASKVNGILRLIQLFLKILLTTPGTDVFAPRTGAAALRNIGASINKAETGGVVSDFVIAVDSTSRQIISIQSRDPRLPLDERLLSARVISSHFDVSQAALVVSVEITSQAGRLATANVVV